jgi:uncharacterized protein (TIGR03067 family)
MNTTLLTIVATALLSARGDAPPAAPNDLANLQGAWVTVSIVDEGKAVFDEHDPPTSQPIARVEYEGTKWMVKVADKTVAGGTFKLDASKSPKELDVMDESGVRNDMTKLAIYELDGDTYRYCIARAGEPRPTEFKSIAGSGHSLIVSRREKC